MDIQSLATYVHPLQAPLIGSFISLMILESAHCGFMISFNNSYLIDGFGDLLTLAVISWDFVIDCEIGFVLILIVNLFFIWRVWVFSKKIWPVCILVFLVIARYALSSVPTWLAFHFDNWSIFKDHAYVPLTVSMGIAALGDTLIASTLAYYLHFKRTQSSTRLITRLLAYVVATGALTRFFPISLASITNLTSDLSILSIAELISITASPNSLLYVPFALVQVKVYANSALLSLNLRQYQRKPRHDLTLPLGESNSTPDHSKTSLTAMF
ncbi:hypothetical protein J3A83DRAFT_4371775 [Scleroderma citrinum]